MGHEFGPTPFLLPRSSSSLDPSSATFYELPRLIVKVIRKVPSDSESTAASMSNSVDLGILGLDALHVKTGLDGTVTMFTKPDRSEDFECQENWKEKIEEGVEGLLEGLVGTVNVLNEDSGDNLNLDLKFVILRKQLRTVGVACTFPFIVSTPDTSWIQGHFRLG